jgi:hypothetical protein
VIADRLFISHAAADKSLADLFQRLLILSGFPRERIFYSSSRATGIPAGRGSRDYLKQTLRGQPFVMELITQTFMRRPMCLMELGAAWALDLPTFPIVVPPLRREEVVAQIGDVQLPQLGEPRELDELFDDLHDRVQRDLGVSLSSTDWNPAVRDFKRELEAVLGEVKTPAEGASAEAGQRTQPTTQLETTRLTDDLVASRLRRLDAARSTDVVGQVTNESAKTYSVVLLGATFFDREGGILGTASGSVNGLPGGSTKSFRLSSLGVVQDVDSFTVQSNGEM